MPKVVITHKVENIEKWLKGKAERAAAIAHLGGRNVVDHVSTDGSNTVAITAEHDDPASVVESVNSPSPELGAAMADHGVVPPITIHVEQ